MSDDRFDKMEEAIEYLRSPYLIKKRQSMSDDRFEIIEKAIQYLLSKHGIAWSLDGVYESLRDKEAINEWHT